MPLFRGPLVCDLKLVCDVNPSLRERARLIQGACLRLDASAVMVNDHPAFRVDWMPFAGLRESGIGVGGIPYTMNDMQIKKLVVVRSKEL